MPKKYRKKPVVIEALQVVYGKTEVKEVEGFVGSDARYLDHETGKEYIRTLEGDMLVSDGDYIIKGIQGEFYPCKPDIFETTYEAASVTEDTTFKSTLATMLSVFPEDINKKEGSVLYDLFAPLAVAAVSNATPTVFVKGQLNGISKTVNIEEITDNIAKRLGEQLKRSL